MSDKSHTALDELLKIKSQLKQNISEFTVNQCISGQLETLIKERTNGDKLYSEILAILNEYASLKTSLLETLESEQIGEIIPKSIDSILSSLSTICDEYKKKTKSLQEELSQKNEIIARLSEQMKPLIEHKAISIQKDLFVNWFRKIDNVKKLKECQSELSTKSISTLAKRASQILVTENLKTKFKEELDMLGLNNLSVELSDAGALRGQAFMQLNLVNNNSVTDVLSEGEQKGVALALFIAERRMQLSSNNPIILDDPVNSLDHSITAKLVERLSTLDNQIIVFSHDLLLQTSLVSCRGLHECGKNQISSCTKKNKHLFLYSVESHGRDSKGIITELAQDNISSNLNSAKLLLNKTPYTKTEALSIGALLRHTIELMIDEKIFNNQVPIKFHGKKNNIQWDQLKKLNPDAKIIDNLRRLFERLSGGELHIGVESSENPIDHEELESIFTELQKLK